MHVCVCVSLFLCFVCSIFISSSSHSFHQTFPDSVTFFPYSRKDKINWVLTNSSFVRKHLIWVCWNFFGFFVGFVVTLRNQLNEQTVALSSKKISWTVVLLLGFTTRNNKYVCNFLSFLSIETEKCPTRRKRRPRRRPLPRRPSRTPLRKRRPPSAFSTSWCRQNAADPSTSTFRLKHLVLYLELVILICLNWIKTFVIPKAVE